MFFNFYKIISYTVPSYFGYVTTFNFGKHFLKNAFRLAKKGEHFSIKQFLSNYTCQFYAHSNKNELKSNSFRFQNSQKSFRSFFFFPCRSNISTERNLIWQIWLYFSQKETKYIVLQMNNQNKRFSRIER